MHLAVAELPRLFLCVNVHLQQEKVTAGHLSMHAEIPYHGFHATTETQPHIFSPDQAGFSLRQHFLRWYLK